MTARRPMRMTRRRYNALTHMAQRGLDETEAEIENGSDDYTADDIVAAQEAMAILWLTWGHLSDSEG